MITVSTSNEAYHHGSLREALVAAGMAALEGREGKDVSLRELARTVGVSPTAVYRHFPDKKALADALATEGLKMLYDAQKAASDAAGDGPGAFAATGRAYVRFALAHPALFRFMFTLGDPILNRPENDQAQALLAANTLKITGDKEKAERLALQAWAIAHGIAMLMLDGRIPADDALIDRLIDQKSLFPSENC
ncbi:TetR/AcrR family transcriptional regulator [Erythrobacter mangrovi]|uniref:WHG domain-containing protein n=1 Tax=Erythrobacter mangrovi TaxID=2739433 RepID=A0A7D4B835_9SPHN|nr:TetR/AcrR family transcriptional regulator [Erythrobacter mangrovi]QKG71483.1 WHG domain-containing protein [Erythrobacter mangrovi]